MRIDLSKLGIFEQNGNPRDKKVLRIIKIEYCNLKNDDELAEYVNVDRCTLERQFKAAYGLTPKNLRDYLRILKASFLMKTSHLKLKDIARECGFETYLGFWRVFRNKTGVEPTSWRRMCEHDELYRHILRVRKHKKNHKMK